MLRQWIETVEQAAQDTADAALLTWSTRLRDALADDEPILACLAALLAHGRLGTTARSWAHTYHGRRLCYSDRDEEALIEFDRALAHDARNARPGQGRAAQPRLRAAGKVALPREAVESLAVSGPEGLSGVPRGVEVRWQPTSSPPARGVPTCPASRCRAGDCAATGHRPLAPGPRTVTTRRGRALRSVVTRAAQCAVLRCAAWTAGSDVRYCCGFPSTGPCSGSIRWRVGPSVRECRWASSSCTQPTTSTSQCPEQPRN